MRLRTSKSSAEENLVRLLNLGYQVLEWIQQDHDANRKKTHELRVKKIAEWGHQVELSLCEIFPTKLEWNQVLYTPKSRTLLVAGENTDTQFEIIKERIEDLLQTLSRIIHESLPRYTDFPQNERLYVEDIDSFLINKYQLNLPVPNLVE